MRDADDRKHAGSGSGSRSGAVSEAPPPPIRHRPPRDPKGEPLHGREEVIAAMLARGFPEGAIAAALDVAPGTVSITIERIGAKLESRRAR